MITITITIQAKTTEEALDALTEIEIRGNSEVTSHCERMRDELYDSDSQDQEKDIVCSPKRKKKVSIHPRDEEAACVYGECGIAERGGMSNQIATCGHSIDDGISCSIDDGETFLDGAKAITYGTYCDKCIEAYFKNGNLLNKELLNILQSLSQKEARVAELERELELRHSWVKHHQKSVEIALSEKHKANDKMKELEQVILEMAEAMEFYLHQQKDDYEEEELITRVHLSGLNRKDSCNGEIKGTFKLYGKCARSALTKHKSIIEEVRGRNE